MQILGLDVHSANFILAHMNGRGKLCRLYERPTSVETLIDVLAEIPGPKRMVVEESHMAQWVKHVAEAYVDELIVCDPKRNKWVAGDDFADDKSSARKQWLGKLKEFPALQHRARHYFTLLETIAKMKDEAFRKMVKPAKNSAAFDLLQSNPGVGPVVSTGYIALIDTPHRFSRKNKLWAYACLGNKYHESDHAVYRNHASKTGCRPLKWAVLQQFNAAVCRAKKPNRFKREYERLTRSGLDRRAARRAVCRSMLSTVRAMWIKGQAYRDSV